MIFFCKNKAFKKTTFFIVFFFGFQFLYSQDFFLKFLNHPEYDKEIQECSTLLKSKEFRKYDLGFNQLIILENTLIKQKDFKNLEVFYLNASSIFYINKNAASTLMYLDKGMLVLKEHPNNEILGFYYENYAVSYALIGKQEKAKEYLLKSKHYLEKYVSLESRLDLYYNLCVTSSREKDWGNVVKYGNLTISINDKSNKPSPPNLLLLIGKAYLNLNKINEAKKMLSQVENLSELKKNENKVLFRYYELIADVARMEKRYEEAGENYKKASEYRDDVNPEFFNKFKNSTELENENLQSNFQLEKERVDFQSDIFVSIDVDNPALIYLTITFSLLVLLIVLLFSYSRAKTKANELLNKKNDQLNKLLETKNKFLNIIAHELRTPLNAITSILYLLKEKYDKTEKENLTILEHSSDYLISLSNNIIEYNVLSDDKKVKSQNVENNLEELVVNILDSFRKIDNNGNKVTFLYDKQLSIFFLLDKSRLTQVLNNIIDNAFKFSEKGNIIVKLELLDKDVENNLETIRFSVEDDGIGIDNGIKNEIFDLFFQGSEEISIKYGGSGIGLALVKKTLKLFKTKLEIISKDKGTIVFFDLPLQPIQKSKSEFEIVSENGNLCSKKHILVVEDNKINQILVQKILISKGYTCAIAENGLVAVEMAKNNDYCLILMDIMMPVMDGFEASEEIGKIKPDLPIVALTAVSEELNKEKFERVQIRKILNKPINVDELTHTVSTYCD